MQQSILRNKTKIMASSGVLIVIGFIARFTWPSMALFQVFLMLASILGVIPIAMQAFQALRVKVVSIDVLVTLAVTGAFFIQNYEESALVSFLFLFGSYLEQRTLNKTRSAIKELTEMAPEKAFVQTETGDFAEVAVEELNPADIVLIRTGDRIPVDGVVTSGTGHVNEASIAGESVPVTKEKGHFVFAGSILVNGSLQVQTQKVGEETVFGRIIELVEEAQDSKSEAERFIDRFSKYYTPAVLVLSLLTWLFSQNLELAITILVLGCPGALVIGVPVSHVAGIGNGAKNGILFKGSEVISDFARVDVIAFDKTGTLTVGKPQVSQAHFYFPDKDLALAYLVSLEKESSHPLAQAVIDFAPASIPNYAISAQQTIKGAGIVAQVDGKEVAVGSQELMLQVGASLSLTQEKQVKELLLQGNSLVFTAIAGKIAIIMGIRDQIRPDLKQELERLKQLGADKLIILSGDNQYAVDQVARELDLSAAKGKLLPADKHAYIEELQKQGLRVAFVGDGINDSPSLAQADIGIAMGSGTDVAIETSNVVLMQDDFSLLVHALGLSRAITRNMRQNMVIAVGTVLVLLASVFLSSWMNMSIGMLAHEASILVVILNAMRLLRYRS